MTDLITIAEAADTLGCKPGDVDRLISQGQLRTVTLVDVSSVETRWRELVRATLGEEAPA